MNIGILGGAFNPPHIGHIVLANEAKEKLNLKKVFFIPTNISPHKQVFEVDAKHRMNMVKLAIEHEKDFVVLDWELKRKGVSYTIDTIKQLKGKYKNDNFFLIIGSDLVDDFNTWKDYKEIMSLVKVIVAKRDMFPFKNEYGFDVIDIAQIGINSSIIRERILNKRSVKSFVPEKVYKYFTKHKLYSL